MHNRTIVLFYPRPTSGFTKERRRDVHQVRRIYAPLSIMYLAATLENAGFAVLLLDHRLMDLSEMKAKISNAGDILFFGISTMTGSQITDGLEIAKTLRECYSKEIPIVWGGVHPTLYPESTILNPLVDIIVYSEGDYTVVDLAVALSKGDNIGGIRGICYKKGSVIEITAPRARIETLDELPFPAWDHLKEYLNPAQYPILATINTSRGCPYNCSYCYKGGVDSISGGDLWRPFSVDRIMKEVDYLFDNYGFDVFETADENFILSVDRSIEIIRKFKDRGFKISAIRSNFHTYKEKVINELPGFCDFVAYSPETGSAKIQKFLNKIADYEKMKILNRRLAEIGLTTVHTFIFGFPFETEEDIIATVNLCKEFKKINPQSRMGLYQYMPYPGAALTDLMQRNYGLVLPHNLEEWSKCDMYGDLSLQFRPWIKEADLIFYNNFQLLFNVVFNTYQPLDKSVDELYASDPRIQRLLGDISSIPRAITVSQNNILNERLHPDLYEYYQQRIFI